MLTNALGRVRHVCHSVPHRLPRVGVLEIDSIRLADPVSRECTHLQGKVDSSARALNVAFLKAKFPL